MNLADLIHVNTRYTRAINVERDRGSPSIVSAYLPTARSIDLLGNVADALGSADQPRAWSLVGPYGSGKSSFALFLHELLGPKGSAKQAARNALAAERGDLARRFARQGPWCRVVLTGSEEPLASRLLKALDDAATSYWDGKPGRKPAVVDAIRRASKRRRVTDSLLLDLMDGLLAALERNDAAGGLLIVIDELGKLLEYEARQGGGGIFLLQQIAERAFRGGKANILFFVLLHQGFDLYARGMGEQLKNDWAKVQGRFESVSFVESPEQTLRIVAAAVSNSLDEHQRDEVRKGTARMAKALLRAKALPASLDGDAAAHIFASCYPIHPIALLALPRLCQRFAQNERTLFSYLGSREPHGFQDSLASLAQVGDWVTPDAIYDYFVHNQPAVLADPLTHRRWAEVATAVERVEGSRDAGHTDAAGPAPLALAKTIGVLNLISKREGLKASEDVLRQIFASKRTFQKAIDSLVDLSVVQYRRFSGEYRVWQGTDFDIDERTDEERGKLGNFDLATALTDRATGISVLARRHSARTGAVRHFEVSFVDARSRHAMKTTAADKPRIMFFLAEGRGDDTAFSRTVSASGPNDLWARPRHAATIRSAIADALTLEGVERSGQELAADPVASREVRERLQAARATEREILNGLVGDPSLSDWYWRGKPLAIANRREFQRTLSNVLDHVYAGAPIIRNELVNRDRLSSQSAAARNKLFQHMLADHAKQGLNIRKYPPERTIYRSVLEAGQLHVETATRWTFAEPGAEDPLRLRPAWNRIDELVADAEAEPVTLEQLMDALASPPFGVKRGVFPILFLHYYLLHRFELAIYDEGTYAPTLTYEHLERMMRRPDLFSFQRFRIEGVRAALFDEYSRALFGEIREPVHLLDLARPLTQFVMGLDEYAQKTKRLSETTIRVRQAFFLSKSPEKFLFNALPAACGIRDGGKLSGFAEQLIGALRELKGAQSALRTHMLGTLCASFGLAGTTSSNQLRTVLSGRCHGLDRYTVDALGLRSFIRRLCEPTASDEDWLDSILLFLGRKPATRWTDQDRDTAEYRVAEYGKRLLDLEKLRLHFESRPRQDSSHETILVKTVSSSSGEIDEAVSLNQRTRAATANARQKIDEVLAEIDTPDLMLALVAQLTNDYLIRYREANMTRRRTEDAIRSVG